MTTSDVAATPAPVDPDTTEELVAQFREGGGRVKPLGDGSAHYRFPPALFALVQQPLERRVDVVELHGREAAELEALHQVAAWQPPRAWTSRLRSGFHRRGTRMRGRRP